MTPAGQPPSSSSGVHTYAAARVGRSDAELARPVAWLRARGLAGVALGALLGLLSGCGDDPQAAPLAGPLGELWQSPSADPVIGRACTGGQVESCALTLGEHDGMLSCYEGTRSCQGGVFGPCENGHTFTLEPGAGAQSLQSSAQGARLRPLSISDPSECVNNPCNRYCREFVEVPMTPLVAEEDPSAPPLSIWPTAAPGDYTPEWQAVGIHEPCQVAGDCQFNTSCVDPAHGSCNHSVCSTGEPLILGCSRCADAVCAVDPDCCGEQPECIHDPCTVAFGAPLDKNCDPCVQAVCTAHPECCDVTWNSTCVDYIATECAPLGQSCGCPEGGVDINGTCFVLGDRKLDYGLARDACDPFGFGQTPLVEIDDAVENDAVRAMINAAGLSGVWLGGDAQAPDEWTWRASPGIPFFINDAGGGSLQNGFTYENWADGQPVLGALGDAIVMGADGEWHHESSSNSFDYVCQTPYNTLNPRSPTFSWSPACAQLAVSTCGVDCPDTVPLGLGACVSRLPTELDPICPRFDLSLGATCEDSGRWQIPVCNHGQIEAPLGLRLAYVPVSEFARPAPDTSLGGFCNLNAPIPPGRCVIVDDCPGLLPDMALVVNPADGSQNTDECRLDDNWSVYQPLGCSSPTCEAGTYSARQVATGDCSVAIQNPLGLELPQADVQLTPYIPQPHCAEDEVMWGASCYFFSSTAEYWDRAETLCRNRGGHLVALNSPAENLWVRDQTDSGRDVQIGLNDKDTEAVHLWSNGTCRSYDNWDTTTLQPNDPTPGSESCTRMTAAAAERWEDTDCSDGQHPYVCELPVREAQGACATGELMGPDGNCYFFDPNPVQWSDAKLLCGGRGAGWDQVLVDSIQVNDFIAGMLNCTQTWIGGVDPVLTGMAVMIGDPFINEFGRWDATLDGLARATLCRGPALPPAPRPLAEVGDLGLCTGGDEFFFEGSSLAPESIKLCPATCVVADSLIGGRLDVAIPCANPGAPVQETTIDELYYEADCDGGGAIWDFFYYDAVTPADSRIEFSIRTAPTKAELVANTIPFTPIAQAHAIPTDTQRCEVDPLKNCPVDIFTKLGAPSQQYEVLELEVKLVPGSSGEGPLLRDWRVRYSCPPSQ